MICVKQVCYCIPANKAKQTGRLLNISCETSDNDMFSLCISFTRQTLLMLDETELTFVGKFSPNKSPFARLLADIKHTRKWYYCGFSSARVFLPHFFDLLFKISWQYLQIQEPSEVQYASHAITCKCDVMAMIKWLSFALVFVIEVGHNRFSKLTDCCV